MTTSTVLQRIDLEQLAGHERYANALHIEGLNTSVATQLRGIHLTFVATSRRLLWQALGHEYIEPELLDFIDAIPKGATFYDVGASTGIFAMYAAIRGCKVVAFEPEAANFSVLCQNAFLNRSAMRDPALCFNLALSDSTGLSNMFIKKYEAGGHLKILGQPHEVGSKEAFVPEHVQPVLTFKMDDFLQQTRIASPEYVKIDVDGAELSVLRGLTGVLNGPNLKAVFIELEEGMPDTFQCIKALTDAGFTLLNKKQVQNYRGLHNLIFTRD